MPFNRDEIVQVVAQLAEQENLQVTIKESAKGACLVGGSAFAGGLFGGPIGLCIGGIAGSVASLVFAQGKYRSVVDIIMHDMTPTQQRRLADSVNKVIKDVRIEDFTLLLPFLVSNVALKELVIKEVIKFIQSEMTQSITRV